MFDGSGVIYSAIIHLCETSVGTSPTGQLVTCGQGVKFKLPDDELRRLAMSVQEHIVTCQACMSKPLDVSVFQCLKH